LKDRNEFNSGNSKAITMQKHLFSAVK